MFWNMSGLPKIFGTFLVCSVLLACKQTSPAVSRSVTPDANPGPSPASSSTSQVESSSTAIQGVPLTDDAFLDELAKDTWTYLSSDWATSNHLPWSWRSATLTGGDFANTAEIGLLALSWLAAYDLQRPWSPAWSETEAEVSAILDQLRAWQTGSQSQQPHGPNAYQNSVFYQWYWISSNPPVVGESADDHDVPSVDNAWLAASLITIREYAEANNHVSMAQEADDILRDLDFTLWYDLVTHRFHWGDTEAPQGGSLADYYSNENRIINFMARALGDLSQAEFLLSLDALIAAPAEYGGITVEKVSWDGSYFTYTSPALFIRELDTDYGQGTIRPATQAQIAYAQDQGYAAWGLSDCYDIGAGGYVQQGSPPTGMSGSPETRPGLVTPHASALALIIPNSGEAVDNLELLSTAFPALYDPSYGFRDSVMADPGSPDYGQVSDRYTALAQEWLFLSLVNKQTGFIWEYFYLDFGVSVAHREMFDGTWTFLPVLQNKRNP